MHTDYFIFLITTASSSGTSAASGPVYTVDGKYNVQKNLLFSTLYQLSLMGKVYTNIYLLVAPHWTANSCTFWT